MYEISKCIKRKDVQERIQMHREFHEKLLPRRSGMMLNE